MRQRIDLGAGLVALGAVGLLISLFLDWFSPGLSAWDVFELVDWLLAACAIAALVAVAAALREGTTAPRWLTGVVVASLVLVASQVIDPPPIVHGREREIGAWLALASALVMNLSVVLAAASVSVTV